MFLDLVPCSYQTHFRHDGVAPARQGSVTELTTPMTLDGTSHKPKDLTLTKTIADPALRLVRRQLCASRCRRMLTSSPFIFHDTAVVLGIMRGDSLFLV
jgi:hypothetical protein